MSNTAQAEAIARDHLQPAYERMVRTRRYPYHVYRKWEALSEDNRAEFIGVTRAVLDGSVTYNGGVIPDWVVSLVTSHRR